MGANEIHGRAVRSDAGVGARARGRKSLAENRALYLRTSPKSRRWPRRPTRRRRSGVPVLAATAAGDAPSSAPGLQLHALQAVAVWVPEEDGGAARHGARVLHAGVLEAGLQGRNVVHACAEKRGGTVS